MIYILFPIYNEAKNIENLFAEMNDVLPGEQVFFVFSDDGSTDNSRQLLSRFFQEKQFVILGDGKNHGPGNAFNTGFEWILEHSGNPDDIVVTMEADCTSDISLLSDMVNINRLGYSLVLASVYAQGGGFEKTSFFRKVLSSVANLVLRFIYNIKVQTISSFYRVYAIGLLRNISASNPVIIEEKGFICMLEILIKAIRQHARVIEVPMVLHSSKRVGKSKMKIFKTSMAYLKFMFRKKSRTKA